VLDKEEVHNIEFLKMDESMTAMDKSMKDRAEKLKKKLNMLMEKAEIPEDEIDEDDL